MVGEDGTGLLHRLNRQGARAPRAPFLFAAGDDYSAAIAGATPGVKAWAVGGSFRLT